MQIRDGADIQTQVCLNLHPCLSILSPLLDCKPLGDMLMSDQLMLFDLLFCLLITTLWLIT